MKSNAVPLCNKYTLDILLEQNLQTYSPYRFIFLSALLILFAFSVFANKATKPSAYNNFDKSMYLQIAVPNFDKSHAFKIQVSSNKNATFEVLTNYQHFNGDISLQAQTQDKKGHINVTLGTNSIFGEMHYENKHFLITTEASGSWLIELPTDGISYNNCGHVNHSNNGMPPNKKRDKNHSTSTVIDLMVVYDQALQDRYPGDLMQTRLNQYMNVTNQATVNSGLSLVFRLVGFEYIPYNHNNSNFTALEGMRISLSGGFVFGMDNLKQRREQLGADIVIFIRPHDIETRGSCGVARFPFSPDGSNFDNSLGIHMISDGMSSWSLCTDQVMVHELGHNLGAGHNDVPLEFRYIPDASGFAKAGQFATVMGSFGTGQPTRFFELDTFSNPNIRCAGVTCGIINDSNNSNVITQLKDVIASYQPSVSQLPIPEFTANTPDSDTDGVSDWDDHFPFDINETSDQDLDGVGDNTDIFITDPTEQFDFDNDGIGNNQDSDDDNDGINDTSDSFPLNALETKDSDNDGIGDNADIFPNNFSEHSDFDGDGIGDNQDNDDDGDSYIDLDNTLQDLLIINTGSNQILRIDAQTGGLHGAEVLSTDGLLTFQSDLTFRPESQTLFYTSSSGVRKLNLMTRNISPELYIPAYDDNGGVQIGTGFPTSLSSVNNGKNLAITRLNNANILITSGQEIAHNDTSFNWNLLAGDKPIDIISFGENSYILSREKLLYKTQSSQLINPITTSSGLIQVWMDDPYALAISSDNNLFISNQNSNSIARLSTDGSNLVINFITLTDFGFSNPTGLVVTNDNILLVAASDQNSILKFNPETGDFLGVLMRGSGVNKPHKMILVPKLNDRYHHNRDKVLRPNAGFWYNSETNGRGFDIHIFGNLLSVIWYTYDEQGLPIWYISSGELQGFEFTGDFLKTHLNSDGSVSNEEVGQISISFQDERNALVDWQINGNQGSESIQWIVWSYNEEEENYTGLWNRPDAPGWGISIATIGKISVAIPYIYDSQGNPRWLISNPVDTISPLNLEYNAVFSNTLCPSCSGVSSFSTSPAGSMTLDLSTNKRWSSNIDLPVPLIGNWILNNTEIVKISSNAIRPR